MARTETLRPESLPELPEFLPLEFTFDPKSNDPKAGLVEWVDEGVACALNPTHRFRPYRRRHHCRACGLLVCSSCSRTSRPLQGFGLPGDCDQRLCDACATRSNDDLNTLATLWQVASNKNATASDMADAMNAAYDAEFRFVRGDAPNWSRMCERLTWLLRLEVGTVENLLTEVLALSEPNVERIDELALARAQRLLVTLERCAGRAPIGLPDSFREKLDRALRLRQHCELREVLTAHQNRMMRLVNTPFDEVAISDLVEAWGAYQAWAEHNRIIVSKALEDRVRELLNRVVRRDQAAANAELELALNSKNLGEIRKAMTTCESVMGVLTRTPYREHVMPDIHVVIPGFAARRRGAMKLLNSSRMKRTTRVQSSLFPPKRI